MQPQLTLVTEVQIAFFTLIERKKLSYLKKKYIYPNISIFFNSHGRASLQCGCAGGSSVSAGAGSAFHRCRMDMASHPCGLAHGHGDGQPMGGVGGGGRESNK